MFGCLDRANALEWCCSHVVRISESGGIGMGQSRLYRCISLSSSPYHKLSPLKIWGGNVRRYACTASRPICIHTGTLLSFPPFLFGSGAVNSSYASRLVASVLPQPTCKPVHFHSSEEMPPRGCLVSFLFSTIE